MEAAVLTGRVAHPDPSVLFAGHSLGVSLACLSAGVRAILAGAEAGAAPPPAAATAAAAAKPPPWPAPADAPAGGGAPQVSPGLVAGGRAAPRR